MAFLPGESSPGPSLWRATSNWLAAAYRELAAKLEAYPFEKVGLAAVAAGLVLRFAAPFFMDFRADGDTYTAMGHAWMLHHNFLMPYGDVSTWGPTPPMFSNHYPPAYPLYLGIVFTIFGFGLWQAKWAAVFVSVAALAVVYWCTRDLYGKLAAALTAGLIAVEPHFIWSTGTGFSENLVLLFFALTMWAILRSLNDDRYIVLAGLFAGLSYLTRSSVGYFFVIAGAGGFMWRLSYRGWGVLKNKWYVIAILLFGSILAAWAGRNVALFGYEPQSFLASQIVAAVAIGLIALGFMIGLPFVPRKELRTWPNLAPGVILVAAGSALAAWVVLLAPLGLGRDFLGVGWTIQIPHWETSAYIRYVQNYALARQGEWWDAMVRKIPYFILFLAWWVLPMLPESWRATKRIREESTSALWLSIFLVWVIAWVISAMFTVYEKVDFISNNHRYVVIGLVPLAWLVLREAKLERASTRLRVVLLALSLFAVSAATFEDPIKYSDLRAAEFMDPFLHAGDQVAVDGGTIKYAFYPYLTHPETIRIYGCEGAADTGTPTGPCHGAKDDQGNQAEWILTLKGISYQGYQKVGTFSQRFADGGVMTSWLWARDDVVSARSLPVNVVKEQ